MVAIRIARTTDRFPRVIPGAVALVAAATLVAALAWTKASAEEPKPEPPAPAEAAAPAPDPVADLRTAGRGDLPVSDRLAALGRLLQAGPLSREQAEPAVRAATGLLGEAPEAASWLVLRGFESGPVPEDERNALLDRVEALTREAGTHVPARALLSAIAFLAGYRPDTAASEMTGAWPPNPFVEAVLRRDLAEGLAPGAPHPADAADGPEAARRIREQLPSLRALDEAADADPSAMRHGLDALADAKEASLPLLIHEARAAAEGAGDGRLPRATRAVLALGFLGDRRARTVLTHCLLDAPSGWVRVAAATALGDLGDPGAAIALGHHLLYRGDVFRPRDAWEYPGAGETNVPQEAWTDVDYFATDCAAADALLRMGVRNAGGWLLRNKMDPGKATFRIRVLQDATDALRRSIPSMPVAAFNPDAGIPQRRAALRDLLAWWDAHRKDPHLTKTDFPEDDPSFRDAAILCVDALRGAHVMELQIAQETCALLGPAMTRPLLEAIPVATSKLHRGEIARALGVVEDPRAIPGLFDLLRDPTPSVRSVAAESLGTYADRSERSKEVVAALVAMLDNPEPGDRVSALKALTAAAPSETVRAAAASHPPEKHEAMAGTSEDREYRIAWTVTRFVQEPDAPWPPIAEGLRAKDRYERRQWWDLLQRALSLPEASFDPLADPGGPGWRDPDEAAIRAALRARRGA